MSVNLIAGVATLFVALVTFGLQLAPRPKPPPGVVQRPSVVRGVFGVLVLGIVPLIASFLFFGAAWLDAGQADSPAVQAPSYGL